MFLWLCFGLALAQLGTEPAPEHWDGGEEDHIAKQKRLAKMGAIQYHTKAAKEIARTAILDANEPDFLAHARTAFLAANESDFLAHVKPDARAEAYAEPDLGAIEFHAKAAKEIANNLAEPDFLAHVEPDAPAEAYAEPDFLAQVEPDARAEAYAEPDFLAHARTAFLAHNEPDFLDHTKANPLAPAEKPIEPVLEKGTGPAENPEPGQKAAEILAAIKALLAKHNDRPPKTCHVPKLTSDISGFEDKIEGLSKMAAMKDAKIGTCTSMVGLCKKIKEKKTNEKAICEKDCKEEVQQCETARAGCNTTLWTAFKNLSKHNATETKKALTLVEEGLMILKPMSDRSCKRHLKKLDANQKACNRMLANTGSLLKAMNIDVKNIRKQDLEKEGLLSLLATENEMIALQTLILNETHSKPAVEKLKAHFAEVDETRNALIDCVRKHRVLDFTNKQDEENICVHDLWQGKTREYWKCHLKLTEEIKALSMCQNQAGIDGLRDDNLDQCHDDILQVKAQKVACEARYEALNTPHYGCQKKLFAIKAYTLPEGTRGRSEYLDAMDVLAQKEAEASGRPAEDEVGCQAQLQHLRREKRSYKRKIKKFSKTLEEFVNLFREVPPKPKSILPDWSALLEQEKGIREVFVEHIERLEKAQKETDAKEAKKAREEMKAKILAGATLEEGKIDIKANVELTSNFLRKRLAATVKKIDEKIAKTKALMKKETENQLKHAGREYLFGEGASLRKDLKMLKILHRVNETEKEDYDNAKLLACQEIIKHQNIFSLFAIFTIVCFVIYVLLLALEAGITKI